jgi:tetratricopeptide (TPR) repeat protein
LGLFIYRKHYRIWIETHEIGLASARAGANRKAQALVLESLASAYLNLRDFSGALRCCDEALWLERATGHLFGEGMVLERLGVARLGLRDLDDAVDAFNQALAIYERLGRRRGAALMRRQLGEAFRQAGRYNEALEHLMHAYQVFVDLHERYNEARTLSGIAETYIVTGRMDEAEQALTKALADYTQIGAVHAQADAHVAFARLAGRLGEVAAERDHLENALFIYKDLDAPQVGDISDYLAGRTSRIGPDDRDDPTG